MILHDRFCQYNLIRCIVLLLGSGRGVSTKNKNDGKRRNTLSHLDQYTAQIVNKLDTSAPPPTNGFYMIDD